MEQNIQKYIEDLFVDAPKTQKAYELKVELTQNLIDKFHALIEEGKSVEDAYNITILSIGDISELIYSLYERPQQAIRSDQVNRRAAKLKTTAIVIYILSVIPPIINGNTTGLVMMLLMIAAATGILIYNSMTKAQVYTDGSVVSDFRDWQVRKTNRKQLKKALSSILWPMIVVVYMLISFITSKWYLTWLLFPCAVAVQGVLNAFFSSDEDQDK